MISFWTVVERALAGPICTERDFELDIFVPNLRKMVEKYGIKYDPQNPVPSDDDLADRVWEAGMESGPCGRVFGEGKDARVMPKRVPEDTTPPWCSVGPTSSPLSSELYYVNLVKAHAENPLGDGITIPCLTSVNGQPIVGGSPLGIEGAIRAVLLTREGMRRAGRPGMPIVNGVTTAARAQEHIAASHFGI
ncbi:MAG: monomethylamine:corrinoid methyltransferase, partial [Dehalococcoidia bacterium]|nr:monomethylamine:corrinoid methyltransferase [Dehalococcoidia bacterium]